MDNLILHASTGTGKNFVSDFVGQALYKKGIESNYVHKFTADIIISEQLEMNQVCNFFDDFITFLYKSTSPFQYSLAMKIKNAIKDCPYSLFVFDEIEKLKPGVFDAIVNLLDHHSSLKGYDFTKAIFIFLSNSAGILS